jgi:UDP-N-acetylglucosamine--N-acetylmuramyl-(pentapeptide) pyrophosphoryl-undecaprenol N-acetylglucosamine transferase
MLVGIIMSKISTHIVFSGGGTGGHLFPGLAVAERLSAEIANLRVTFAGSGKAFERKHVLAAGYEYLALPCRPLPGKPGEAIPFVVENLAGYFAARRFLKVEGVDAVVGLGGYASVPMGRAAVHSSIPLALLEQNAIPGRATRWLSKRADLICTSFDETENCLTNRCTIRNTGNPVRKEFFSPLPMGEGTSQRLLLILGGSGGARSINENVPRALYKLNRSLAGWKIVHQTGEADCEATQTLYRKLAIDATVLPFIHDLSHQLSQADLIVCRAGGTTLAELAAKAVPAVLVPFPAAKDDHQRKNARIYAEAGAAAIVEEPPAPGRLDDALADPLESLLTDAGWRQEMSAAMARLARPHAAEDVAELVWSLVCSRSWRAKLEMAA